MTGLEARLVKDIGGDVLSDCAPHLVRKPRLLFPERTVVFTPEFIPQRKIRKKHADYDANWNHIRARKNASVFFCHLYQALFGGRVTKTYKTEVDHTLNGSHMNFHPDLVKHTQYGPVYTEVKGKFINSGFFNCGALQLQNYLYKLLVSNKPLPCMNYGLFVYGDGSTASLGDGGIDGMVGKVCRARELLIMPANVLLLAMMLSPKHTHNQTSSDSNLDEQFYFHCSSGTVNALRDLNGEGFFGLMRNARKDAHGRARFRTSHDRSYLTDTLGLRQVRKECLKSSDVADIRCSYENDKGGMDVPVKPFLITRYVMTREDYGDWLARFRKRHTRFLHDYLHVKDLCCDDAAPF